MTTTLRFTVARVLVSRFMVAPLLVVATVLAATAMAPAASLQVAPLHGRAARGADDYVRMARQLAPRAERGDPAAAATLGFLYSNGLGVPQSYEVAVDLYLRSAEQGDSRGQYLLGLMYDKGLGVPQDWILAYKWLDLAAASASRANRENFLKLRNAVAFKLAPVDVAEGQRLAIAWTATHRRW